MAWIAPTAHRRKVVPGPLAADLQRLAIDECALGAKAQSRDPGAPGVQGIRLYREKSQLLRTNMTMTTTTTINTSTPPPMNMATSSFL